MFDACLTNLKDIGSEQYIFVSVDHEQEIRLASLVYQLPLAMIGIQNLSFASHSTA